jgi:hypothetical protein
MNHYFSTPKTSITMETTVIIHKAKNLKGNKLVIQFSQGNTPNAPKMTMEALDARPHEDLVNAMQALRPHVALLGGFLKTSQITIPKNKKGDPKRPQLNDEQFDNYRASGISVSGRGIIITGQHTVEQLGKMVVFNTPLINVDTEGEGAYEFIDDLVEVVNKVKLEFALFIGGKQAPDPQLKMDMPDSDPEEGK